MHTGVNGKKKGTLPERGSFCQLDQPNVLLLTLKQAEDKRGLIVRLMETEGEETEVTVRLPSLAIAQAFQTNLVEEDERPLLTQKHKVAVSIKAFGIITIRVQVRLETNYE